MTAWPDAPAVLEIDTWPWLTEVGRRLGRPVTLADVPADEWDAMLPPGLDAVWLMGVWERSPAGLAIARSNDGLERAFHETLPDLTDADVAGSPYCVRRYVVDERLGGSSALLRARAMLRERGLRLILDYVPNHVAPDHPAVTDHPEWFIRGDATDLAGDPGAWYRAGDHVVARGRDPYFPPWPDVVQLNAFHPEMRQVTAGTLIGIADLCDGIRVDMAMLVTTDVFARTWGERAGARPAREFWPEVIAHVREVHPDVVLIAEAYWEMEWTLQQQGFAFCYDKRLYDRLAHEDAGSVRKHLEAGRDFQDRLLRFTENHDEQRAATAMPGGRSRAAAVAVATLPGATLWHDGQYAGARIHTSVFLGRRPDETADEESRAFHHRLVAAATAMRRGGWQLAGTHGWPGNDSHAGLLAWVWHHDGVPHHVVVVNLSGGPAQARIPLPGLAGRDAVELTDLLDGATYPRGGAELAGAGLYVDLPAWGSHVLAVAP